MRIVAPCFPPQVHAHNLFVVVAVVVVVVAVVVVVVVVVVYICLYLCMCVVTLILDNSHTYAIRVPSHPRNTTSPTQYILLQTTPVKIAEQSHAYNAAPVCTVSAFWRGITVTYTLIPTQTLDNCHSSPAKPNLHPKPCLSNRNL